MEFELKYCKIVIILEGKKEKFDYVINDRNPPLINRKHLETPLPLGWLRNMWTTPYHYSRARRASAEGIQRISTLATGRLNYNNLGMCLNP